MKKFLIKRLLFIPLGVIAFAATIYAQLNPEWTEYGYSQQIYPVLSSAVGYVPSLVSFSVAEWLMVLLVLFCLGYLVYYVRAVVVFKKTEGVLEQKEAHEVCTAHENTSNNNESRGLIVYRGIMGIVALGCVIYFAFTFLCGLNYHRSTFASYTSYTIEESSVEELEQLCVSLADELGQARAQLGNDTDLSPATLDDFGYYAQQTVLAMEALSEHYPILERPYYSLPKPVLMSELLSYSDIGGVFFPFTAESNVNAHMPFYTIPSTMAHELAHQCGFMREDEANFIAYLVCRQSDDPLVAYSGLLSAFNYSISALSRVDLESAKEIAQSLPEPVQHDRAGQRHYWTQYEGAVADISSSVNDAYLRSNNQDDGVQSYGRMVDLLLAEQRAGANE